MYTRPEENFGLSEIRKQINRAKHVDNDHTDVEITHTHTQDSILLTTTLLLVACVGGPTTSVKRQNGSLQHAMSAISSTHVGHKGYVVLKKYPAWDLSAPSRTRKTVQNNGTKHLLECGRSKRTQLP